MHRDLSARAFLLGAQLDLYEHQFDRLVHGRAPGDDQASLVGHLRQLRILTGAFPAMLADMIQVLASHAELTRRRRDAASDAGEHARLLAQHREGVSSMRLKCLRLIRAQ